MEFLPRFYYTDVRFVFLGCSDLATTHVAFCNAIGLDADFLDAKLFSRNEALPIIPETSPLSALIEKLGECTQLHEFCA